MSSGPLIDLLQKHIIEPHGVVNLRAVLDELMHEHKDPVEEFTELFNDPRAKRWYFYALEGMRGLAVRGYLEEAQATKLLAMTESVASQRGEDEYFESIEALAHSPKTLPVLVGFIQQTLERHDTPNWRWLAFFAAETLLRKKAAAEMPSELVAKLEEAATQEHDERRKRQLAEIAHAVAKAVQGR